MSSFSDSGGEDGGDICNIFDFDKDNDVAGMMQSEWDEGTSTTTKKRKFKALLIDGELCTFLRQAQGHCLLSQERLQLPFDAA